MSWPSWPRTLRGRVTAAAALAAAFAAVLVTIATVATFADRERADVDRQLLGRARGPLSEIGELRRSHDLGPGPPGTRFEDDGRHPPPPQLTAGSGSFVRILQDGDVRALDGDVPDGLPIPDGPGFTTVGAGGGEWRVLTLRPPLRAARLIQVGANLTEVDQRIGELRTRVAALSALGALLAATLVWLLAAPALEPLSRLRRGVAGVSSTRDLSLRVPSEGAEEVRELGAGVNAMLGRLEASAGETEAALEATRRFAADVGHELRTPLTSIRANFGTLERNPALDPGERGAILTELAREQDRLVAMLDSLQALARGDAGKALPMERIDFADVVDAAVEAARGRHPGAELVVRHIGTNGSPVHGWPDGLRLVADNLIENALRHGGGRVEVELSAAADGAVRFVVDDDGPGVPASEREAVFERFFRGSRTHAPGSGLGLALVAQQAELHRGSVEVDVSPLGGARFSLRLPAG